MPTLRKTLRKVHTAAVIAPFALLAVLCLCSRASAATVEALEEQGPNNRAALEVRDDANENNQLQVRIVGESGSHFQFEVTDFIASLTAGPGCEKSGDSPSVVACAVHKPGEGWSTLLFLDVGGGHNFLDAAQPALPMIATGGSGEDVLITGGANDIVDPGAGRNVVGTNPGDDEIIAAAALDEGDLYDGGYGTDRLSYARRSQPVHLFSSPATSAPGTGEVEAAPGSDQLFGVEVVLGGEGDDTLIDGSSTEHSPAPHFARLEGGPGNDVLEGGVSGGFLIGGPGDDTLKGGDDFQVPFGIKGSPPHLTSHLIGNEGNDLVEGGSGRDLAELGPGEDIGRGGEGNDRLDGGTGRDLLLGGDGDDLVIGDGGFDRLFGGSGRDRFFAARRVVAGKHPLTSGSYDGRDQVGCGPDADLAFANPWDRVRGCERVRLQPQPRRAAHR